MAEAVMVEPTWNRCAWCERPLVTGRDHEESLRHLATCFNAMVVDYKEAKSGPVAGRCVIERAFGEGPAENAGVCGRTNWGDGHICPLTSEAARHCKFNKGRPIMPESTTMESFEKESLEWFREQHKILMSEMKSLTGQLDELLARVPTQSGRDETEEITKRIDWLLRKARDAGWNV